MTDIAKMKAPQALLAVSLICMLVSGCGGTSKPESSALQVSDPATHTSNPANTIATVAPRSVETDIDGDNDHNSDDYAYGAAANPAVRGAVTALIKSYYAAAAAEDGARACSLIYSIFAEEIPEVYGEPPGSPTLRGGTCAIVMSKVFKQNHRTFVTEQATLHVSAVRVKRLRGRVLLIVKGLGIREMLVHREHSVWRIDSLLPGPPD